MVFVKVLKNKAYHKRYQVKFRRRRQCKTDYYARKRLVVQDKNKYNTPKYRLVVRFSNKNVTCQVAYSKWNGDVIVASAESRELGRYGVKFGLTNYAAAYCTGLLVARRILTKLNLADAFVGQEEVDGDLYLEEEAEVSEGEWRRPFSCILDVGLVRTTTGAKVFGALKGAVDGGVHIPHSVDRFPGYEPGEVQVVRTKKGTSVHKTEGELDVEFHRKYIFGGHVADYLREVASNPAGKNQFSAYIKAGIGADDLEEIYSKAHAGIRADPFKGKSKKTYGKGPSYRKRRLTLSERKNRVKQIKASFLQKLAEE